MARKEKGAGIQKKLPTKSEVRDVNKRLYELAESLHGSGSKPAKTADSLYSIQNEIVNESTFKKTKSVSPSGKSIELKDELQFPMK